MQTTLEGSFRSKLEAIKSIKKLHKKSHIDLKNNYSKIIYRNNILLIK